MGFLKTEKQDPNHEAKRKGRSGGFRHKEKPKVLTTINT